jgi:hypothetical protein
MLDGSHHGEGEHDERDVTMPAVPGSGLVAFILNVRPPNGCCVAPPWPHLLDSVTKNKTDLAFADGPGINSAQTRAVPLVAEKSGHRWGKAATAGSTNAFS